MHGLSATALAAALLLGHAAEASEQFHNRTFVLSYRLPTGTTSVKIYVDRQGRVFAHANNTGCRNTGATGRIGATETSSYTCPIPRHGGMFTVTTVTTASVRDDTFTLLERTTSRSEGAPATSVSYEYRFALRPKGCASLSYVFRGAGQTVSVPPVRCRVTAGRS